MTGEFRTIGRPTQQLEFKPRAADRQRRRRGPLAARTRSRHGALDNRQHQRALLVHRACPRVGQPSRERTRRASVRPGPQQPPASITTIAREQGRCQPRHILRSLVQATSSLSAPSTCQHEHARPPAPKTSPRSGRRATIECQKLCLRLTWARGAFAGAPRGAFREAALPNSPPLAGLGS